MYKLTDLPRSEMPRERLLEFGAHSLSETELLAIVLSSGSKGRNVLDLARELLLEFGNLKGIFDASHEELMRLKSIGSVKATILKAVCELALRINNVERSVSDPITGPEQIFKYTKRKFFRKKQELVVVVVLDSRGRATSLELLSIGTLSSALIEPRGIFRCALRKDAASLILVHNHPSGDPMPSTEDIQVTHQIVDAGKVLGISLVDHVIVTDTNFVSMKALGFLAERSKGGEWGEKEVHDIGHNYRGCGGSSGPCLCGVC